MKSEIHIDDNEMGEISGVLLEQVLQISENCKDGVTFFNNFKFHKSDNYMKIYNNSIISLEMYKTEENDFFSVWGIKIYSLYSALMFIFYAKAERKNI